MFLERLHDEAGGFLRRLGWRPGLLPCRQQLIVPSMGQHKAFYDASTSAIKTRIWLSLCDLTINFSKPSVKNENSIKSKSSLVEHVLLLPNMESWLKLWFLAKQIFILELHDARNNSAKGQLILPTLSVPLSFKKASTLSSSQTRYLKFAIEQPSKKGTG